MVRSLRELLGPAEFWSSARRYSARALSIVVSLMLAGVTITLRHVTPRRTCAEPPHHALHHLAMSASPASKRPRDQERPMASARRADQANTARPPGSVVCLKAVRLGLDTVFIRRLHRHQRPPG
jgi:hypothetical protein